MSQPALRCMAADEFLEWQQEQDRLYELIDGQPVGMVGSRLGHDMIVVNALASLRTQLSGSACRPFTEALAVRIPAGNVRRPDVSVVCGPFDARATSGEPRLVIEVLSPSTRQIDVFVKLEEYKTVASLDYILLIDPDVATAVLLSRDDARVWQGHTVEGLDSVIALPSLGLCLRLAELYDGLVLRPLPRLVREEAS